MKPDERLLLLAVARLGPHQFPFNVAGNMHPKRLNYLLEKWTSKGWFDYGVSARTGWLTPLGLVIAGEIAKEQTP